MITFSGVSFGSNGTMYIGSQVCMTSGIAGTSWSTNTVVCQLPSGTATQNCYMTVAGQNSNTVTFTYDPPSISSVTPSSNPTAGQSLITIQGSSFNKPGNVTVNDQLCTVQSWSQTSVTCTIPAGQGSNIPLNLMNDWSSVVATSSVNYNSPSIIQLSPSFVNTNGTTVMTLYGQDFGNIAGNINVTSSTGGNVTTHIPLSWSLADVNTSSYNATYIVPVGAGSSWLVYLTSATGANSNQLTFNYHVPILRSLSPSNGPTTGGYSITMTGDYLYSWPIVTIGGVACNLLYVSSGNTNLTCIAPAGEGRGQSVIVNANGQPSNAMSFNYDPPAITNLIFPSNSPTQGGVLITIQGTSFGSSGATVTIGSASCAVQSQNHTLITCVSPGGSGVNITTLVIVSAQQSQPNYQFGYSAPTISYINMTSAPTTGYTSSNNAYITVIGSNFGELVNKGAYVGQVYVGNTLCPSISTAWGSPYQNDTRIVCQLPSGSGTNLPVTVRVLQRASNYVYMSYDPPSITSINPVTSLSSGDTPITIYGNNFGTLNSAGSVYIGGKVCSPTFSGFAQTSITCLVPPGQGTNNQVVVTVSAQSAYTSYSYKPPSISSIVPSNGMYTCIYNKCIYIY